jgi:hypothetical protein
MIAPRVPSITSNRVRVLQRAGDVAAQPTVLGS